MVPCKAHAIKFAVAVPSRVPLFGTPNDQAPKNKEMGGAMAFGGSRLIERHNNQLRVGVSVGRVPIVWVGRAKYHSRWFFQI